MAGQSFGPLGPGFDNSTYTLEIELGFDGLGEGELFFFEKNELVIFGYPVLLNGFVSTVPGNPLEQ